MCLSVFLFLLLSVYLFIYSLLKMNYNLRLTQHCFFSLSETINWGTVHLWRPVMVGGAWGAAEYPNMSLESGDRMKWKQRANLSFTFPAKGLGWSEPCSWPEVCWTMYPSHFSLSSFNIPIYILKSWVDFTPPPLFLTPHPNSPPYET